MKDNNIIQSLSYDEKIESIVSTLATPFYRRKLNDEPLHKLITDVYFEMKKRKENNHEII